MNNRAGCTAEQRHFWQEVEAHGLSAALKELRKPHPFYAIMLLAADWLMILGAFFLCMSITWLFMPLAIFVIGVRQGALNNLLHDASHKNLARHVGLNNFLGQWLCALPSFTTLDGYRERHRKHHSDLGNPADDPDFLPPVAVANWKRWVGITFTSDHLVQGAVGNLLSLTTKDRIKVFGWWTGVVATLTIVVGAFNAAGFAVVWILARIVVQHPISTFREMIDHYGLHGSTWLGYTRNVEGCALIAAIIHPHQDGYHLVHHLDPRIPLHRTKAAHRLLRQMPLYARLHHCDGYVFGKHSLCRCLNGRC